MRCHRNAAPAPLTLATVFFVLLLTACRRADVPVRLQWVSMGTVAAVQCANPAAAPQARDLARQTFEALDQELSVWREDSALSAVNRAAGSGVPVPVPTSLDALVARSLAFHAESEGAFNPLLGPLMRAWGFNGAAPRTSPPTPEELRAAAALADCNKIARAANASGPNVRLAAPDMRLDLGAIAKGYAVDCAWERLAAAGHTDLLVDLGGNLRARGEAAPGRGGWRTGVRNPFDNTLAARFLLRDGEAVATSGNYERFVTIGGTRYAHIMDARTGFPVAGMAGVTVLAPSATLADALSTTLFILGPVKGPALLRRHPGCEALWIPDTPGRLSLIATPGLAARLEPLGPTPYALTVLGPETRQ